MNEFWHLLGDPSHWGFEAITDLVFGPIYAVLGAFALRLHDRRMHTKPSELEYEDEKNLWGLSDNWRLCPEPHKTPTWVRGETCIIHSNRTPPKTKWDGCTGERCCVICAVGDYCCADEEQ